MFEFCPTDGGKLSPIIPCTATVGTDAMDWITTGWKFCELCVGIYALFEAGFGEPVDNGSPALVLVSSQYGL